MIIKLSYAAYVLASGKVDLVFWENGNDGRRPTYYMSEDAFEVCLITLRLAW